MELRPTHLANELVKLVPLQPAHMDELFAVAADPLIWEQHPEKHRYKKEVFQRFFDSGIASEGAFLILDARTGQLVGSTRYYDHDASSVAIGYTFIARSHWGGPFNSALKELMINYAFSHISTIYFHVGANNMRSQKAVLKLGAIKTDEVQIDDANGAQRLNLTFELKKEDWFSRRQP